MSAYWQNHITISGLSKSSKANKSFFKGSSVIRKTPAGIRVGTLTKDNVHITTLNTKWQRKQIALRQMQNGESVNYRKPITNQALVAHIYNPSYSGGRDEEDRSSKPAQANSL
jgi:hypothetical protein